MRGDIPDAYTVGCWYGEKLVAETFDTLHRHQSDAPANHENEHEQSRNLLLADAMGFSAAKAEKQVVAQGPGVPDESNWRWPMPRAKTLELQPLALELTKDEKERIGKKVWNNESGGTFEGLTAWNKGEEFPSLGIGHFIWLPKNADVPFGQSFPEAMQFVKDQGATLPSWLKLDKPCPWESRRQFLNDFDGKKLTELRQFLKDTVPQQTDYLIHRLENALPGILQAEDEALREKIQTRFYKVLNSGPAGVFTLVDYVNFKGEGTALVPEYNNHAWGLKQVLEGMKDTGNPVQDFANSAKETLRIRVENAPKHRHEEQWLQGWYNRIDRYVSDPPFRANSHHRHR